MIIAEKNIPRQEDEVSRVALEMREGLDELAGKDPTSHAFQNEGQTVSLGEG